MPARAVAALRAHGIDTLADLTVRIPRRRQWWRAVPGLGGAAGARSSYATGLRASELVNATLHQVVTDERAIIG